MHTATRATKNDISTRAPPPSNRANVATCQSGMGKEGGEEFEDEGGEKKEPAYMRNLNIRREHSVVNAIS